MKTLLNKFEPIFQFLRGRTWLVLLLIFLAAFGLRSVKANYFGLWDDELITARWDRMDHMMAYHKWDNNAPFAPMINLPIKLFTNNNIYAQRLPHIIAVSLAVVLFYQLFWHFSKSRRFAAAATLLPMTSFALIYFSQEIRPYSYLLLFSLMSIFYAWRVLVEKERSPGLIIGLLLAFVILPVTHYMSWLHFVALDFIIAIAVLGYRAGWKDKLAGVGELLAVNVFLLLVYIPWADTVYYYIINQLQMDKTKAIHRFTTARFWELTDKLSGQGGWWSHLLFYLFLIGIAVAAVTVIWQLIRRQKTDRFAAFALLLGVYWALFFLMVKQMRNPEDIFFWRHYIITVWPFFIVIGFLLWQLVKCKWKPLPWLGLLLASLIIGYYTTTNLVDDVAYYLASHRFYPYKQVAEYIEPFITSGRKQEIWTDMPGRMDNVKYYLKTDQAKLSIQQILATGGPAWTTEVDQLAACCKDKVLFIRMQTNRETKELPTNPDYINYWPHQVRIGADKYLVFLNKRGAAPYSGWFETPIIYW